jgi:hypothetical protein
LEEFQVKNFKFRLGSHDKGGAHRKSMGIGRKPKT